MLTVKTDSRERVRRKIKRSQKALGPQLIILSEMAQLHAHCVSKCGDDADKSIIIFEEKKKEKKKGENLQLLFIISPKGDHVCLNH